MPRRHEIDLVSLCHTVVPGWKRFHHSDINFDVLAGGLSNKLYTATLSPCPKNPVGFKNPPLILKVVVRIFGDQQEGFICENEAQLRDVEQYLADHGYGASILHNFDGGRIETWLSGRTLKCLDLQNIQISLKIAEVLASFHSEDLSHLYTPKPLPWLVSTMNRWLKMATKIFQKGVPKSKRKDPQIIKKEHQLWLQMANVPWDKEVEWLLAHLDKLNSPIVFCHNDVQEGNIISDKCLTLIDFEYASYNYRGFDFGNHFCEVFIDYGHPSWPYFYIHQNMFPDQVYRRRFIRKYLKSKKKKSVVKEEDVAACDQEAVNFMMASHLIWVLWSFTQYAISDIEFGYLHYAVDRFILYSKLKENIIQATSKEEIINLLECVHITAMNRKNQKSSL